MMTVRCVSRSRSYVACVLLICGSALVNAQATPPQATAASTLSVAGDVRTPLSITPAELNPNKSSSIRGFALTQEQRADLVAFLQSLTDEALLRDPRFGNPWLRQPDR